MNYEDLMTARDYIETLKKCCAEDENNKKFVETMLSVIDYADGCYISHCEEVGKIAIQDIKRMEKNWLKKSCEWLSDCLPNIEYITNASALRQNKKQFIESYKKAMQKL